MITINQIFIKEFTFDSFTSLLLSMMAFKTDTETEDISDIKNFITSGSTLIKTSNNKLAPVYWQAEFTVQNPIKSDNNVRISLSSLSLCPIDLTFDTIEDNTEIPFQTVKNNQPLNFKKLNITINKDALKQLKFLINAQTQAWVESVLITDKDIVQAEMEVYQDFIFENNKESITRQ